MTASQDVLTTSSPEDAFLWALERLPAMPNLPLAVWKALQGWVRLPAIEIVITGVVSRKKSILLVRYEGGEECFRGLWHIPGGYLLKEDRSIDEAVRRVARRELGFVVQYGRMLHAELWNKPEDHPTGRPVSIFLVCLLLDEEHDHLTEDLQFFPLDNIPEDTVLLHKHVIERELKSMLCR